MLEGGCSCCSPLGEASAAQPLQLAQQDLQQPPVTPEQQLPVAITVIAVAITVVIAVAVVQQAAAPPSHNLVVLATTLLDTG